MTQNWYIILELEFAPNPIVDEDEIEKKIEEKRKFWSSKSNDFMHGAEYRKYTQMIPTIRKDMIGEDNIRDELIKDACKKIYEPIDKMLSLINKSVICEDTVEKIAKRQKIDIKVVKERANACGIHIKEAKNDDYHSIYEKYIGVKPQNADKYLGMNALLNSFNVSNLYEFLFDDISIEKIFSLSCEDILQRVYEKKTNEFNKNDSISGTGTKICAQCEDCFKDEKSKEIYDKYLYHMSIKEVLDDTKLIFELVGELTSESFIGLEKRLVSLVNDKNIARAIIVSFCKVENIPILCIDSKKIIKNDESLQKDMDKDETFSSNKTNDNNSFDKTMKHKIKICRCGYSNDISDGRTTCASCGQELKINTFVVNKKDEIVANPPQPINNIIVNWLNSNELRIDWENTYSDDIQVRFFYSYNVAKYRYGEVMLLSKLEQSLQELEVTQKNNKTAIVKYSENDYICIYPVVVKTNTAVIGEARRVRNFKSVEIKNICINNNRIMISLIPPRSASGFIVFYRSDRFAQNMNENDTCKAYISMKKYLYDGGIVIESNVNSNYYFTIVVEYEENGAKFYSSGVNYLFHNEKKETIVYHVSLNERKKLFKDNSLLLTFVGENKMFWLPEMVVMCEQNREPISMKSGNAIFYIQGQNILKEKTFEIPIVGELEPMLYIKPFITDARLADSYDINIRQGCSNQIS